MQVRLIFKPALLLFFATGLTPSHGSVSASGEVAFDGRYFPEAALYPQQFENSEFSIKLAPELTWQASDDDALKLSLFYRYSFDDDGRTHGDIREAYWRRSGNNSDFTLGASKVFWGVTESRHLVDVINQTDVLEDIDGEDKLGQPMINMEWYLGNGQLGLFWLPYFREQDTANRESRLRLPLLISDDAEYESSAEEKHQDAAIRYSFVAGDWDIGLSGFYGTSREPIYRPQTHISANGTVSTELVPYYEIISQASLDAQLTTGAWLYKLEAIGRSSDSDTFAAAVAGFEYTLFQIHNSPKDLGLILEYLWDGRNDQAPQTLFDDDIFIGTRLAFNDIDDSSILIGSTIDTNTREYLFSVEAETRITPNFVIELTGRWFEPSSETKENPEGLLATLDRDDYIELSIIWSF